MEINFISIDILKSNSTINENVDSKLLLPTLKMVQDVYLRPTLGVVLFDQLKTAIDANTLSVGQKDLLDNYIEPYLINKIISEGVIDLNYKIRNKALMVGSSENSQPLDENKMTLIQVKYKHIAESYRVMLSEFISDSINGFTAPCATDSTHDNPIFTGNVRHKTRRYL